MFLLTIVLSRQVIVLHYDSFKDADSAMRRVGDGEVEDDYGCKVKVGEYVALYLTDVDREMEAQEKVDMAKVRKDLRIRRKIEEDPVGRIMLSGGRA